jgi:hypothetical protein
MKPNHLIALLLAAPTSSLMAADIAAENLTIQASAFLGGLTSFGYNSPSRTGAGFTIAVDTGITTIQREEIIPAHTTFETTYLETWDWIMTPAPQIWVEEYGDTSQTVQVPEYGMIEVIVNVDAVTDPDTGEVIVAASSYIDNVYGMIGYTEEVIPSWGVVGGHYEQSGPDIEVWGVVDSQQVVTEISVPEQRNSYTDTVVGVPVVVQTAQTADTVWSWRNQTRDLVQISPAGISIPAPYDPAGKTRSVLTSTMFEQSFLQNSGAGTDYRSHGVKMTKDNLEAWNEVGQESGGVSAQESVNVKPSEITLQHRVPDQQSGTVALRSTRISPSSAQFGGLVQVAGDMRVQGVLRVQPAGDLSMEGFTNGPQP